MRRERRRRASVVVRPTRRVHCSSAQMMSKGVYVNVVATQEDKL